MKPLQQMGLRPPGFQPSVIAPLLLAQTQASADQQIAREIRRDAMPASDAFNAALQRDRSASVARVQRPPVQVPVQQVPLDQAMDLEQDERPGSPVQDENEPLLEQERQIVDEIIQAQPAEGRPLLEANRDRIAEMISLQALMKNKDKIQEVGKYLWEWFYTKRVEKQAAAQFGVDQPVFDQAVPPHCKIQYYWNEQKQKLERIMICNDESRNERVYYGV